MKISLCGKEARNKEMDTTWEEKNKIETHVFKIWALSRQTLQGL